MKDEKKNIVQGIIYGLIPHIGCIAFIIGSIFGVTVFMKFFRPFLLNRYSFPVLISVSLAFATISSILYLKKNSILSLVGIKRKWKYLLGMYGSTIGVNLLLFFIIFPMLSNVKLTGGSVTGMATNENIIEIIKLKVNIPCPGHASLISQELNSLKGIKDVQFSLPNIFKVSYNPKKVSKQQILSLSIFKSYSATVI